MYNTAIMLVSSFFALGVSQDPCIVNKLINEPKRSPSYVPGIGEALICDRGLADGWYRFANNGMMPEKCIDRYHCGTHDPIWFMGKHPDKQGQEATGKACANTGFGANCCGYEVGTITVKHCGSFFAYRLSHVQGCSFAYCSGKGDPCPFGTSSPSGYQPGCVASFPAMAGNPTLLGPFRSGFCSDGNRYTDFYFTCRVSYLNPIDANVAFEIKWLIDGKPINVISNIFGFDREASIHVNQLQTAMGHELSCSARSYYLSSPDAKSPFYISTDHYRMEIKFDPGQLELDEKSRTPTEIKLVSTVPIVCASCSDRVQDCVYSLHMHTENATTPECNITLSYNDWDDTRKTAEAITHIEAEKDFINDNKTGYLQPEPFTSTGVNAILNGSYVPPPLQVQTKNSPAAVCIAFGEPHVLTFDRNNAGMAKSSWTDVGYYDMYHVGMFTMVQTKAVPPHIPEFQVQIQTQTCWTVACICGVVAREGTDVVSINTCDFRFGGNTLNEEILHPDHFSNKTTINEEGKSYKIRFPSGRTVKVYKTHVNITNVEVQVRPDDANNVEGLCGEYNGHPEELGKDKNGNKFNYIRIPDDFIESNRIPAGSNMYEQSSINYTTPANYTRPCKCMQDLKGWHIDCKPDGLKNQPGCPSPLSPNCKDVTPAILSRSKVQGKKRPSKCPPQQCPSVIPPPVVARPTKCSLYEPDVRHICQDAIDKEDTLRKCKSMANIDFGGIIEPCVEDIKITCDVTLAKGLKDLAMSMCLDAILKNPNISSPGKCPAFNLGPPPCQPACTGHGNCTQGKCICNDGFGGDDCSVNTTNPPIIEKIDSENPCAVQNPNGCGPIFMSLSNFYKSDFDKCHLQELKFSNGTWVKTGYGFYSDAEFVSATDVMCRIPQKDDIQGKSIVAYAVSVTSDGILYSQSKTFAIYDSDCMTCDANSNCVIKPHTCMIDGKCRAANETKHDDQTYMCDPHVNNTEWTRVLTRADIWTRTPTGCVCYFNTSRMDCACCENGEDQCPFGAHNQCVQSGFLSNCGTLMPAPTYGIDGYTKSFTGCPCDHDKTLNDCACCQNGGVQCGSHYRNQCVQSRHLDQCGQKQHIFGP